MWRAGIVWGSVLTCAALACTSYTTINNGGGDGDDTTPGTSSGSNVDGGGSSGAASSGGGTSSGSSGVDTSSSSSSTSASSSTSSSSSTGGLPLDTFEQQLLDGFNQARASASPAPDPALSTLTWDYDAEQACQTFTDVCAGDAPSGMVFGGGTSPIEASQILDIFLQERPLYSYPNNTCSGGSYDCVLYKMVVKRTVNRVGCAHTTCGSQDRWACKFSVIGDLSGKPY